MGEKRLPPTPHRLSRARREGDVAKSAALTVTVSGAIWWLYLIVAAPHLYSELVDMMGHVVQLDMNQPLATRVGLVLDAMAAPVSSALATLGMAVLATCLPEIVQTGGVFAMKRVTPDFSRLDPIQGFKNLFGPRVLFEMTLMVAQFVILAFVCWLEVARWLAQVAPALALTLPSQLALGSRAHAHLLAIACLSQLAPAALDFAVQRVLRRRRLRMDKEELKREFREQEGDPHVKQRRRAAHRQLNS